MKKIVSVMAAFLLILATSKTLTIKAEKETLVIASPHNEFIRNEYINEWHTFAKQKYADAVELARSAGIDLVASFQNQITELKNTAQNNLYMGLGAGLIVGLIIGLAFSIFFARRREIAAVKK
ncbi:MAG: hypothetical protein ACUVTL_05375 [Thermoproteota archaeon]